MSPGFWASVLLLAFGRIGLLIRGMGMGEGVYDLGGVFAYSFWSGLGSVAWLGGWDGAYAWTMIDTSLRFTHKIMAFVKRHLIYQLEF